MADGHQWRGNRQTISWFVDLHRRDLLELDPPYQRRSVWSHRYREDFVETVLLAYPAPSVFLFEEIGEDGSVQYAVVDGKQRLMTIIGFAADQFATRDEADVALPAELRGKYFKDLSPEAKKRFWSYEFTVEYLPSTEEALLKEVFDRINRNVAKLTRQELRHARYSGAFASAIEEIAGEMEVFFDQSFPRIVDSSRRQMKDVEFAASLVLLIERGPETISQDDLDQIYADREEDWERRGEIQAELQEDLEFINKLVAAEPELVDTRLRNQGDFYALLGAVDELRKAGTLPADSVPAAAKRLREFASAISERDPPTDSEDEDARRYHDAERSAANDTRQRQTRIRILRTQLAPE